MSRPPLGLVVAAAMLAGYALAVASDLFPDWTVLVVLVALLVFNVLVGVLDRLTSARRAIHDGGHG